MMAPLPMVMAPAVPALLSTASLPKD